MRAYDDDFSLTSSVGSPHRQLEEGGCNQESSEDCYVTLEKVGF